MSLFARRFRTLMTASSIMLFTGPMGVHCFAQSAPAQAKQGPDTLVLSDGDTLHGTLVSEVSGTITFHSDSLGDVKVPWDKIKELHATEDFAVLRANIKVRSRKAVTKLPVGPVDATSESVIVHSAGQQPAPQPVATKDAQYVIDKETLDKQVYHSPNFFQGWNGSATAGATLVTATQNQYTFSGSVGLVRMVPTVSWLDSRNRTTTDFSGSFGKITQPAYVAAGVLVPASTIKTAITHFDAERDEYVSPSFFALAQTALDHNYSQNLSLQQVYGGGFGWTIFKHSNEMADLKGTVQYEKQTFLSGGASANQNLVGSTFSADYMLNLKLITLTQNVAYVPAWNNARAYSAQETNMLTFPTYKNLGFSVGTIDSYLNDPPVSLPPTKRNSFQFTMGLTYTLKSKY